MGARFAPSVANLFMVFWEQEAIFNDRPTQLKCNFRYIEDLIIWEGNMTSLQLVVSKLNGNTKNIRLCWNSDASCITFLDLKIFREGQSFKTKNVFKPTDRNSYISLDSCHNQSWLCKIPRDQFILLRRNCTLVADYFAQSDMLAEQMSSLVKSIKLGIWIEQPWWLTLSPNP